MKVGLLTYHRTTNFGSLLQMYALYLSIEKIGVECEVIDYHNPAVDKREHPLKLYECRNIKQIYHCLFTEKAWKKKERNFINFLNTKVHLSRDEYNKKTIFSCSDIYDRIIVGSDLVWDFSINGNDTTYMLDFLNDKEKKVAYASSAGSIWDGADKNKVVQLLSQFKHIGVREEIVSDTLESWLNKKIDFVCDPTMLIEQTQWASMSGRRIIKEDYIICYMFDNERKIYEDARRYGQEHNLSVYVISYYRIPKGLKAIRPTTIEEFLSLIRYAHTVFSASYHGMLFSLYFEKNLFYYNRGWKARMKSIATYLGIAEREQLTQENMNTIIDYSTINEKIEAFRRTSMERLRSYMDMNQ